MSSAPPASQSKPTNHRRHHNAAAPRHHHQQQPQPRYVPKSTAPSAPKPSPPPSLTTALRSSAPPSASGAGAGRAGGPADGFVAYLPHDEAVAAGLGGVDAQESQAVVDLLNDALAALLRAKPREFWRQVAQNTSLHEFLDSYLQFRHRWYDLPHRGPKGTVDGLVVGELELCRRVFMVLYRISSNKDPGAGRGESLSMKEHADLLQEKRLLDLPKLLDICAIYGHDNGKLTSSLVKNAINVQPSIPGGINTVIPQFLGIFFTMQERCMNSLQALTSSGPTDNGYAQLQKDFSEVLDFVNDAIVTLDAFVEAHQPSALLFCASFETSYGVEELPNTLSRLYDSLLPSLHRGCQVMSRFQNNEETASETILSDIVLGIKMLSSRTVKFGWRLLEFCYLNDQLEDLDAQASSKMFPAKVEDPMIRGDILIQTLKDINREATYSQENPRKTFLQALEKEFQLMSRIRDIRNKGWIHIDEEQFKFMSRLCGSTLTSWNTVPDLPVSSYDGELQQKNEDAAITESKISQVRDLFPDYGKGFLAACLEAYNQNPEEVIQRILDGTLHQDLLALDTSLQEMPQRKPSAAVVKDKGKGILVETLPQNIKPHKVDTEIHRFVKDAPSSSVSPAPQGQSSSVSSVPQGRFIRKSNDDLPDSAILDSKKAKDFVRSAVLESQYEYEDEYDDSFDDLGFSVVESSYEETDGANDDGPQWNSQKKPQFYVKDGKNYSYKVAGSVAVSSAREAAVMRQVQKDSIHGLGRGGNVPTGVPNRQHRDVEEEEGNAANNFNRGVPNPRGGGGRGRRGVMDHGNRPEETENFNGPQGFGRGQRRDGRGHGNRSEESENFNSPQGFGRGERKGSRDQGNPPDYSENFNGTQGFGRGGRRGGRDQGNPSEERENSNSQQGFGRGGRRGGRGRGDAPEVNENFNDQRGFGRGAPRGARNHDYTAENNEEHDAAQGFARGGPAPRGGGGRRGGRNHHQKDRAMKKHMQGLTGL